MTALEIATILAARAGKTVPETEADFVALRIPMLGGCQGCGAVLAVYNAHPQKTGYWACEGCSRHPIVTMADWEDMVEVEVEFEACGLVDT